jgi:hypothetical protein
MSITGLLQRGASWAPKGAAREDVAAAAPKPVRPVRLSTCDNSLILAGCDYANSLFSAGGIFPYTAIVALQRNGTFRKCSKTLFESSSSL